MGAQIKLVDVKIAFPNLYKPRAPKMGNGAPKYSASLLFAADSSAMKEVRAGITAAAKERWGNDADKVLRGLSADGKLCLRNGDGKPDVEGFAGAWYVTASNLDKPTVVDSNRAILEDGSTRIYAGCRVNVALEIWAQDNDFGRRINAKLKGVQFAGDDAPFASGSSVSRPEDFDVLPGAPLPGDPDGIPF